MALDQTVSEKLRDAAWLPHRYDPQFDAYHFIPVSRDVHRRVTFLTDEYLPKGLQPEVIARNDAMAHCGTSGPIHFIFHSAFCLSTLLARAFDIPGFSMGLKEPVVLNDLVGWRLRNAEPAAIAQVLDDSLKLLSRPFGPGEAVIVKPSNILNGLSGAMMKLRPGARAIFIHAPLEIFLKSVAKKGIDGRVWIRDLYVKQLKEGLINLNFDNEQYLSLTDLQVAAVCWLAQHALFADLAQALGADRIRTLDSETLLSQPQDIMAAIAAHFGIGLDHEQIAAIVAGPAFSTHSKSDTAFSAAARAQEYASTDAAHGDEIAKVAIWAAAVAASAGVNLTLPHPLLKPQNVG